MTTTATTGRPAPACPVRKGDLAIVEVRRHSVDAQFRPTETKVLVVATVAAATRDGWTRKVTWGHLTHWVPVPGDDGPMLRKALDSPARVVGVVPRGQLADYRRVLALVEGREYADAEAVKAALRPYRVTP